MYGGGMGELGVGRGQIELLAAIFHPDAPNAVGIGDGLRAARGLSAPRQRVTAHPELLPGQPAGVLTSRSSFAS